MAHDTRRQRPVPVHVRRRRRERLKRLRTLGYQSYAEYLKSAHWTRTRDAYFASDRPQQCICGEDQGLQIHHRTYERIGAEHLIDLVALCSGCHVALHVLELRGDMTLDPAELTDDERAAVNRLKLRALAQRSEADRADAARQAWEPLQTMPAEQRLAEMARRAREAHIHAHADLRLIRHMLANGIGIDEPRVQRRLEALERKLRRLPDAAATLSTP